MTETIPFIVLGRRDMPIYLLAHGTGYALIEGGLSMQISEILAQLREQIIDLSLITHWFITHSHYDHCGLLPYLYPLLPNVKVFCSTACAGAFQSKSAIDVIERLNIEIAGGKAAFIQHTANFVKLAYPFIPVTSVDGNDRTLLSGGHYMRAISAEGHARCQLTFFDENSRTAFVSDALGEFLSPGHWLPLVFQDLDSYRSTISSISGLAPAIIALAHHGILTGAEARAAPEDALASLEIFRQLAQDAINKNGSIEIASERLSEQFYSSSCHFVPKDLHVRSLSRMLDIFAIH